MASFFNTMKLFIALLALILLVSCSNSNVYFPDMEWKFSMKRSDLSFTDTVYLKTFDETLSNFQSKSEWVRIKKTDSGSIEIIVGETGIVDSQGNFFTNLFSTPTTWIHPIRTSTDYYKLTEMVPFPKVEYPIYIGQKIEWKLTPKEGWKELEGIEVKGEIQVTDKILYQDKLVNDSCWVIEAYGISDIGKFTSTYYFSEKLGFIYFYYDFKDYNIEIKLLDFRRNSNSKNTILHELYYKSQIEM